MIEHNDFSLRDYNTFGIDVKAKCFIEYQSTDELISLIHANRIQQPYLHIGRGSNLLFTHDYEGTIFHSGIKDIECVPLTTDTDEMRLRVGAGMIWDDFVACCVENYLYGAENLSLIPGEVGAAAVQNIGAYGVEASQIVESVETINIEDGSTRIFKREECEYSYRQSVFKQSQMKHYFITHVNFSFHTIPVYHLSYGSLKKEICMLGELSIENIRKAVITMRRAKLPDPKKVGNAGSFFVNPVVDAEVFGPLHKQYPDMPFYEQPDGKVKISAGWLIEQCGWKGKSLGTAGVYNKQALVLVNLGGATGNDVVRLSDKICSDVKDKFGVTMHPEVNFI
jgi:UDP-N-acetylmuramate dehydrogenase